MKKYVKNAVKSALFKPLRGRYRRFISIGVSALLSISTFLTAIPQTSVPVYAAGTGKNLQLGHAVIGKGVNNINGSAATVYFGSQGEPLAWRVIGYNGDGVASSADTATLLASDNIGSSEFDDTLPYSHVYAGSKLQSAVNSIYTNRFTSIEDSNIRSRTLQTGIYFGAEPYTDGVAETAVSDARLWPLSTQEAYYTNSDLRGASDFWWLRSPGIIDDYAAYVIDSGDVYDFGGDVFATEGVRPAFNINLSSVILTSAAEGGKNPATAGTPEAPGDYTRTEWKLTLHDSKMITGIGTAGVSRSGSTITVPYTVDGDNAGTANRIAVLITDKAYTASDAVIKYYGNLAITGNIGDSGTGTFTLPTDYNTSWKVYILSEQINDNKMTDYASTPVEITIPSKPKLTITAKDQSFTYDGQIHGPGDTVYNDPADMVTVEGLQPGDTLTSITVDGQGKEVGDYDLTPSAAQVNGSSASDKYDVTYAKGTLHITSDEISYTVRFKVKNGEWNNGSKDDVTVTLTGNPRDTLKLSADQIPAVGSKPDGGFKEGNWDTTPSTETAITKDTTYTYTYVPESAKIYTVTATDDGHGSAEPNPNSGTTGTKVTITATADDGYDFKEWKVIEGGVELADSSKAETSFNIKDSDVEVKALFEKKTPEPGTYTVTAYGDGHGDADADPTSGKTGTKVTITATADKGYEFKEWKVVAGGVDLADKKKASTTFNIKDSDVEVKAVFEKKENHEDDDDDEDEPAKPAAVNPDTVEGFFVVSGQPVPGVAMGKTVQGVAAQAVFNATRPTGFLQAFTFNMAVNGKVDYTLKNGVLTIIIPKEFQKAGRTFAIMALDKNGRAWNYADTDTNPNTLTATINVEGYAFALIYKD